MPEPDEVDHPEVADDREPDYRFTLANERTFLAWMRTCLALLAAAVAVVQFAPDLSPRAVREVFGLALSALAAASSAGALWQWTSTQKAMRRGNHLRRGSLPVMLAVVLTVLALGLLTILAVEAGR